MFNHKDKNELSKSTCQTSADFPSNQIVPSRDCSAHLRSSLRRLASGLQRIPYPPRMSIEVTVQNFPVLVVTGIMVLKKKHIHHTSLCWKLQSSRHLKLQVPMKFKPTWRQERRKCNPPALGSCETVRCLVFSKLQKDILALIDAAIQLKFLMHLGKQRRSKRERRSCQCFGRQPFLFRRNAKGLIFNTLDLYKSSSMECSWTPQQHVLLQCQPIWEALQKRSTPQLPSSTKYINHKCTLWLSLILVSPGHSSSWGPNPSSNSYQHQ